MANGGLALQRQRDDRGPAERAEVSRETLTDKRVKSLRAAVKGTRYVIHDGRTGLAVRVTDTGERSWIVRPLLGKRRILFTLGTYPETSLDDARALARGALRAATDGIDPRRLTRENLRAVATGELPPKAAARGAEFHALTFGELAEKFLASPAVTGKRSEKETRRIITTYFLTEPSVQGTSRRRRRGRRGGPSVDWKDVRVADLDRREINAALELLVKRGRVQANQCARTLNRLLRWAAKKGYIETLPIFDTQPGDREESRARVLADWEIREIWKATKTEPVFGPFVRFVLATGLRRTNAATLRRGNVDHKNRVLVVATKERQAFVLPLSTLALEAIAVAPKRSKEYVFSTGGKKPLNSWSELMDRLRKATPTVTERWTLHDLRRTLRTGLGQLGVEWHVAERCIDHVVGSTAAQTYDRWAYLDAKRAALDAWAKHLREIAGT